MSGLFVGFNNQYIYNESTDYCVSIFIIVIISMITLSKFKFFKI